RGDPGRDRARHRDERREADGRTARSRGKTPAGGEGREEVTEWCHHRPSHGTSLAPEKLVAPSGRSQVRRRTWWAGPANAAHTVPSPPSPAGLSDHGQPHAVPATHRRPASPWGLPLTPSRSIRPTGTALTLGGDMRHARVQRPADSSRVVPEQRLAGRRSRRLWIGESAPPPAPGRAV